MTVRLEEVTGSLDAQGWAIVRGAADRTLVEAVAADLQPQLDATPPSVGGFYGKATRRIGRLLVRSPSMRGLICREEVFRPLERIIRRQHREVGLNITQAIAVQPGAERQVPHRDDEMWPLEQPTGEHLVNVIWPLTRFGADNGATMVWSNSHRGASRPADADPLVAEMLPGDALIVLGSTLHAQGANESDETRSCAVVGYHAAWLLPGENPWLSYPPDVAAGWPKTLTDLPGYRRLPPNVNGVDCRCPSELLGRRGFGAEDHLTPEQNNAIAAFRSAA